MTTSAKMSKRDLKPTAHNTQRMTWTAGTVIGSYQLVAPLGAGGMGEVWKARDTRVDRVVAIKRLKPEHAARFQREARAIAALNHPHICQLYDLGNDYLVMEFVEGAPLACPQPAEGALRLAGQIAEALEEAHGKGVVHRDLKPGNILVTSKGSVKLLDFGLAQMESLMEPDGPTMAGGLTQDGDVVGTFAYMSPEQAQGLPVDARSDVFSFGLVLYELISGGRPFRGETAFATLTSIVKDDPAPLSAAPALERIVRRCLAKRPADRFSSMTEVRAALLQVDAAAGSETQRSIAVLPFVNMSGDAEQEYFSDGLAEETLNALVRVPGLKVIARTSAFAFKGQNMDIRRIANALNVTHVLEGSVRKAGNRVRVTAQLIAASDGTHLWSERYDRELADVFGIQDEISQAIAEELKIKLSPARGRHQPNPAAYEAYLKGRHYYQQWNPSTQSQAEAFFREAIALDPRYTPAYVDMGFAYFSFVTENLVAPRDAAPKMRTLAEQALAIDPNENDAHAVLALVAVLDYDWQTAGREFQIALASPHVSPLVRYGYAAFYLVSLGRESEALEQTALGLREDPLNTMLRLLPCEVLLANEDPAGETEVLKLLELHSNFWIPMAWLAAYLALHGRLQEARAYAERAHTLAQGNFGVIGDLAGILSLLGEAGGESLLARASSGEALGAPVALFSYHMIRGELAEAARWMEKAIEQRDTRAPWIMPNLFGKAFRASPYWPPLARKMSLPVNVT